jgi:uncharacterized membrane protein YhaH (DUF805 family)
MNYYLTVLKKYAVFNGRARRSEYWWFILINFIAVLVLGFASSLLSLEVGASDTSAGFPILALVYDLAVLIPSIAVGVRRLHDTGRSGWWLLIALIPFIGAIVLIVFFVLDSTPGPNKYGPNPKEAAPPMPSAVG